MRRFVDAILEFLPRIRSLRTPLGGISWDPPVQGNTIDSKPGGAPRPSDETSAEDEEVALSDHEEEVLVALAETEDGEHRLEDVADAIDINSVRTHYYLDRLVDSGLVYELVEDGEERTFALSPDGRAYLVEHDLID